jgi:hypothetical protein
MENTAVKPELIEKERIGTLTFNKEMKENQHPELTRQILNATRLGNAFRGKVYIYFIDDQGPKCVHTTIWASGAKYVCLKGGVWLPIDHILEIKQ